MSFTLKWRWICAWAAGFDAVATLDDDARRVFGCHAREPQ